MAQLPNITSLTIPESITAITSDTFTDCPQLATITVAPNNPTYASIDGVLYNKALTRALLFPESAEGVVSLPDQTDAVPASALSHCANLSTLLVGQDNAVYTSINGNLYSKDASTLVACPGGIEQTLTLPKQTSAIGPDALAGITTLKSIVVLGNITTIDPTAFNDQAKQTITIALPGGEDYAARKQVWESAGFKNFATPANPGDTQTPDQPGEGTQPGNPADPSKPASGFIYKLLEDYTLEASWTGELNPASTPIIPTTAQLAGLSYAVSALAPGAFENQAALSAIALPNSLTSIGARAFAGTSLKSIDIPTSITTIGDQAFANCPNLTRIITHTNTIQVAPTALEGCTNLELWCPYNEAETYPWSIGLFATNNHIKAYGLPASPQALTLEVGQSANLFEPGTLQAPDPSKPVYAYEATCLSVSQEGTVTAKAPGTTTISTSIELEEIPLTHTTRTISVVAPSTPAPPEQPETPTPTPPTAQPITPRYPPNLATPTQASAPLYSRGGIQPRAYAPTVSVTVPTTTIITIDAAGNQKANTLDIKSNTAEPLRAAKIECTEQLGAGQLLSNLDKTPGVRANTKVTVKEPASNQLEFALSKTPPARWDAPKDASTPFRIEANSFIPITFGLTIPNNATYSLLPKEGAEFAQVEFTFDRLAPMATGLNLTATGTLPAPKVGDTLSVAPIDPVSHTNPVVYTWYERDSITGATTTFTPNVSLTSHKLVDTQKDKFIYCVLSDGAMVNPETWHYSPVYSEETGKVAAGWPPSLKDYPTLQQYEWADLKDVADYLSKHEGDTTGPVYEKFHNYLIDPTDKGTGTGQHKIINLEKGAGTLEVRIVGINHDEKASGGKAGLTFMATHRLPDKYNQKMHPTKNDNTKGWKDSPARAALNNSDGAVWNLMPQALKDVIKPVNKYTNNAGGGSGTEKYPVTPPTQDKLWIPSYAELSPSIRPDWKDKDWIAKESSGQPNAQYEFFKGKVTMDVNGYNNNSDILKSMCNLASGSGAYFWRERSCNADNVYYFVTCDTNGDPCGTGYSAADAYGIVLGFSI